MAVIWYLNYVDPDRPTNQRFLGANLIRVIAGDSVRSSFALAIQKSHLLHINPGGQVEGDIIDENRSRVIPEEFWHKLLSRADVLRLVDALQSLLK